MPLPHRIYRYQQYSGRNIENIRNNVFWSSHPSRFNDPFDCAEAMVHNRPPEVRSDILYDAVLNFDEDQMMSFAQCLVEGQQLAEDPVAISPGDIFFRQQLSSANGVTCFSELPMHLLMWSHYADSHRGFCLEFSTDFPLFHERLHQVSYQGRMPVITPSERELGDLQDLRQFVLTKARKWRYEREWRLLSEQSNTTIAYPPQALTRILVGARATTRTINALSRAVDTNRVDIVRLRLASNNFRLESAP